MTASLPTVLVPGLGCSARLYAEQIPLLWRYGPVIVADHRQDDTIAAIAHRILAAAPPIFALAGLSMGGYIAFAMLRQAPDRIERLALLDTSARADLPEARTRRLPQIAMAESGQLAALADIQYDRFVHPSRLSDNRLRQIVRAMLEETGAEAFARQQRAIMARPNSTPDLPNISCPTLALTGASDSLAPEVAAIAATIPGAHHVVIPNCGHLSTLECPDEVNAALTAWRER